MASNPNKDKILLDIEGTITSISFVKDTLFPYIKENLVKYLDDHWNEEELQKDILALREQARMDVESKTNHVPIPEITSDNSNVENVKKAVYENVLKQMETDRKTTALKSLQGHMWKNGYESKKILGHVYDDAVVAIKKWVSEGKEVMIYSSGSIAAQKLLFRYSNHGDLTQYFSGHFDTTTGPKNQSSSYQAIADSCQAKPSDFTFYTDSIQEAQAAKVAEMKVVLVARPEDSTINMNLDYEGKIIKSFDEIL